MLTPLEGFKIIPLWTFSILNIDVSFTNMSYSLVFLLMMFLLILISGLIKRKFIHSMTQHYEQKHKKKLSLLFMLLLSIYGNTTTVYTGGLFDLSNYMEVPHRIKPCVEGGFSRSMDQMATLTHLSDSSFKLITIFGVATCLVYAGGKCIPYFLERVPHNTVLYGTPLGATPRTEYSFNELQYREAYGKMRDLFRSQRDYPNSAIDDTLIVMAVGPQHEVNKVQCIFDMRRLEIIASYKRPSLALNLTPERYEHGYGSNYHYYSYHQYTGDLNYILDDAQIWRQIRDTISGSDPSQLAVFEYLPQHIQEAIRVKYYYAFPTRTFEFICTIPWNEYIGPIVW